MKLPQLISVGVFLIGVFCGCSSHYYRINEREMTLFLRKTDAEHVVLYSSLDGFAPRVNDKMAGTWAVTLPADREFSYFYEVDGEIYTPWCQIREKDDFGAENCVYVPDS